MRTGLVTALKRKATELLAQLKADSGLILVTQHGLPAAYLVDVDAYDNLQKRISLLEGLARGKKAVQEGRLLTSGQSQATHGAMAEIIWTDPALYDLDATADYICP